MKGLLECHLENELFFGMGDNTGCMKLKSASLRHEEPNDRPDEWPMWNDLQELAGKYGLTREWQLSESLL